MESLAYYILNMTFYFLICCVTGYLLYKTMNLTRQHKIADNTCHKFMFTWFIGFSISEFCIMHDVASVFIYYENSGWRWIILIFGILLVLDGMALNFLDVTNRIYPKLEQKLNIK